MYRAALEAVLDGVRGLLPGPGVAAGPQEGLQDVALLIGQDRVLNVTR